jgi:hypothetical protein
MRSTTDFAVFFGDMNDLQGEDVYHLYEAVMQGHDLGRWTVSRKDGVTFVHGNSVTLCVKGPDAHKEFFRQLRTYSDDPQMDLEAWGQLRDAMQRGEY